MNSKLSVTKLAIALAICAPSLASAQTLPAEIAAQDVEGSNVAETEARSDDANTSDPTEPGRESSDGEHQASTSDSEDTVNDIEAEHDGSSEARTSQLRELSLHPGDWPTPRVRAAGHSALQIDPEFRPAGQPIDRPRPRPNLDRRGERQSVGQILLWVPRVILFPLYLITEYGVRKPLGWIVSNVEEHKVVPRLKHYTTWGDRDGPGLVMGMVPIIRIDRGSRAAFGLRFYVDDALRPGNDWTAAADTDFRENATVEVRAQQRLFNDQFTTGMMARYERRDDLVYYGTGPTAVESDESRFLRRKTHGGIFSRFVPTAPGVGLQLDGEVSNNAFGCSTSEELDICGPDDLPTTGDDRLPIGPGTDAPYFESGYDLARINALLFADTRARRPQSGTGARLEVFGRWGRGLADTSAIHFVRFGSELSGFLDLQNNRLFGLRLRSEFAEPVAENEIPFPELITLGGVEAMRGFLHGRFHGRSALAGTLEYRYPIWSFVDGTVFVEAGNVFGPRLSEFSPGALRGSAGFGLRWIQSRHYSIDLLVALGSSRFDAPDFGLDFARFSFGTNWGF